MTRTNILLVMYLTTSLVLVSASVLGIYQDWDDYWTMDSGLTPEEEWYGYGDEYMDGLDSYYYDDPVYGWDSTSGSYNDYSYYDDSWDWSNSPYFGEDAIVDDSWNRNYDYSISDSFNYDYEDDSEIRIEHKYYGYSSPSCYGGSCGGGLRIGLAWGGGYSAPYYGGAPRAYQPYYSGSPYSPGAGASYMRGGYRVYDYTTGGGSGDGSGGTNYVLEGSGSYCGDGACSNGETQTSCPQDCGNPNYCGDGACTGGETQYSCSQDCGTPPYCGDGACSNGETQTSCPQDCGNPNYCGDGVCTGGETQQSCSQDCGTAPYCGDSMCTGGETQYNCPQDCGNAPFCGDTYCSGGETQYSCPQDCGTTSFCGDQVCSGGETKQSCPEDCGRAPYCGDQVCNGGETQYSCSQDCGNPNYCGDGVCTGGETQYSCSQDCGNPRCSNPSGSEGSTTCEDREILVCRDGFWDFRESVQCCDDYDCPSGYECTSGRRCVREARCGDSVCEDGENRYNCPSDCGPILPPVPPRYCGDGICSGGESQYSCPQDCGPPIYCGDGACTGGETQYSCPQDCGYPPICGDGTCNGVETQETCPQDCGFPPYCGDGTCNGGEVYSTCPQDCPAPPVYGVVLQESDECTEIIQGQIGEFLVTITNTGNVADTYQLSVYGQAASWIQTIPSSITINGGESKNWLIGVIAPYEAPLGLYNLTVRAESPHASAERILHVDVKAPPITGGINVTTPTGGNVTATGGLTGGAIIGGIEVDLWLVLAIIVIIIAIVFAVYIAKARAPKKVREGRLTKILDNVNTEKTKTGDLTPDGSRYVVCDGGDPAKCYWESKTGGLSSGK